MTSTEVDANTQIVSWSLVGTKALPATGSVGPKLTLETFGHGGAARVGGEEPPRVGGGGGQVDGDRVGTGGHRDREDRRPARVARVGEPRRRGERLEPVDDPHRGAGTNAPWRSTITWLAASEYTHSFPSAESGITAIAPRSPPAG